MVPSTMRAGAVSFRTVAREASASSRRVKGLAAGVPPEVPAEAVSELHAAAEQIHRSALAAERQAIFTLTCAHRGVLADGPFGGSLDLDVPGLLSPWAMPADPPRRRKKGDPWWKKAIHGVRDTIEGDLSFAGGAVDEVLDLSKGLGLTVVAVSGDTIDTAVGEHITELVPGVKGVKQQFHAGIAWAARHPKEFARLLGRDAVAMDERDEGRIAHANGRTLVSVAGFVFMVTKVGKASLAVRADSDGAKSAERVAAAAAADARRARADGARTERLHGRGLASDLDVQRAHLQQVQAEGRSRLAEQRIETARQQVEAAKRHLAELGGEAVEEVPKEVAKSGALGSAKIVNHPVEEHAEPGR
jgi:hypothetical protein